MRRSRCNLVTGSVASLTGAPCYPDPCRAGLTGAGQADNQFGRSWLVQDRDPPRYNDLVRGDEVL
jgi:hypothetical protein